MLVVTPIPTLCPACQYRGLHETSSITFRTREDKVIDLSDAQIPPKAADGEVNCADGKADSKAELGKEELASLWRVIARFELRG